MDDTTLDVNDVDTDDAPDTEVDSAEDELSTDEGEDIDEEPTGDEEIEELAALDLGQYGDHLVTVKVGGQEVQVPLSEALEGHMRHADYTQKTQALASERDAAATYKALEHALSVDFDGTVAALKQHLGITDADTDDGIIDPLEREVRQLRAERDAELAERRNDAIKAELASFKEQDPDLDEFALLSYAVDHGIPSLDVAYKAFAYERGERTAAAQADADRLVAEARERKVAAKRTAPPVAKAVTRSKSGQVQGSGDLSLRDLIRGITRGEIT